MKITFIKDCPPILYSGWSEYKAGDAADLREGHNLIESGYAREGWGVFNPEPEPTPEPVAVKKPTRRKAAPEK